MITCHSTRSDEVGTDHPLPKDRPNLINLTSQREEETPPGTALKGETSDAITEDDPSPVTGEVGIETGMIHVGGFVNLTRAPHEETPLFLQTD